MPTLFLAFDLGSFFAGFFAGMLGLSLLISLSVWWMSIRIQRKAPLRSGRFVLRYGWFSKVLASFVFLFAALFAGLTLLGCITSPPPAPMVLIAILLCLFVPILAFTAYLFVKYYLQRIEFDDESLTMFSLWKPPLVIPWSEVTDYEITNSNYHTLATKKSGNIRVSLALRGVGSLLEQWCVVCEHQKTPVEKAAWPETVEEAVSQILLELNDVTKNTVMEAGREKMKKLSNRWGWDTLTRNSFGLWRENRTLIENCGVENPEDAVAVIIEAVWERLRQDEILTHESDDISIN